MGPSLFVAIMAGAAIGLPSAAHCALMCGPLAVHARSAQGPRRYFIGRLASYTVLGFVAGSFSQALSTVAALPWLEAGSSWTLALVLAYAAVRLVRTPRGERPLQIGVKKKPSFTSRVFARLADDPLLLGAFTALLPCGALLSAVLAASTMMNAALSALSMASFAIVTGVGLVGLSTLAQRIRPGVFAQRALASVLAVGALILAYRPIPMLENGGRPACHAHVGDAP